jgi:PhoPQ-activated pathogenicity-related protein
MKKFVKACLMVLPIAVTCSCANMHKKTALDRYVAKADQTYTYKLINTVPGKNYTSYIIDMTSQTWLTSNEVDRPTWKHWLTIVKPDEVSSQTSLLFIGGGSNKNSPPESVDQMLVEIALATKTVVTELHMVPNQPLTFVGTDEELYEDALIAFTWDKYLESGDDKWPARLPMTKSAVRALDTVTDFCSGESVGDLDIQKFVVAGGSKRGWTTWTTAAVDKRVVAIVPIVIDMLNVIPSFKHHFAAYGFYAPAVGDYEARGIMNQMDSARFHKLMHIVEPYEYRNRLTMPKLIINATGDQFFLPDSSQFYFDDLQGKKYLRYVPNTDHSLKESDASQTLLAFYHAILNDIPLPHFTWQYVKDDSPDSTPKIVVKTDSQPTEVKLWQANNPKTRDFRVDTIGKAWTSKYLEKNSDGSYLANLEIPEQGWTANMVELCFEIKGFSTPLKLSTAVFILPETLPHQDIKKSD